jgi:hypothetical protein
MISKLSETEREALVWFLEHCQRVIQEEQRDGRLRPIEARALEAELLRARLVLQRPYIITINRVV